jgi:hypothetical protein
LNTTRHRPESMREPEPPIAPDSIKTYSLEEVAAMVLPPEWTNGRRWLAERLKHGTIRGYKVGRSWRMTHSYVQELIAIHRNAVALEAAETEQRPSELGRRSWLTRRRDGRTVDARATRREATPPATVQPAPSWFLKVHAENPEIVAAMPNLTQTQLELLGRLRNDGQVVVGGRARRTVQALVKRGLATYEVEYVLNANHMYYYYRFTVRPRDA